jgi:hypothetical protein
VDFDGTVSALSGACPVIVFRADGREVYALPGTTFNKGDCEDVRNGTDVAVKGVLMSDGRVRAEKITLRDGKGGR